MIQLFICRCYATGAAAAPTSLGLTRLPPVLVKKDTDISDPALWQNAAILVDKPQDWTSFDVCGKLRGTLHTKKARYFAAVLERLCIHSASVQLSRICLSEHLTFAAYASGSKFCAASVHLAL